LRVLMPFAWPLSASLIWAAPAGRARPAGRLSSLGRGGNCGARGWSRRSTTEVVACPKLSSWAAVASYSFPRWI